MRMVDAAAYAVFGVMMFVVTSAAHGAAVAALIAAGLCSLVYAMKIAFTRGSYWTSTAVYGIAVIGVILGAVALSHHH